DCGYLNRYPEWFEPGRQDDPRLDADLTRGFGPEVITLDSPANGTYRVFVHYFEDYGRGEDVLATVRVYEKGQLVFETTPTLLNERCQAWMSASLLRSGGPQDGTWTFDAPSNLFDDASGAVLCDP
ncbi:MAG: hypothetical protein ACO3JL_18275, partial [Myxococcota bacterium]